MIEINTPRVKEAGGKGDNPPEISERGIISFSLLYVIKTTKPNIKNVMSLDNYLESGVAIYFIRLGSWIMRLTISKGVNLITF